jgi:hypothetical protein
VRQPHDRSPGDAFTCGASPWSSQQVHERGEHTAARSRRRASAPSRSAMREPHGCLLAAKCLTGTQPARGRGQHVIRSPTPHRAGMPSP